MELTSGKKLSDKNFDRNAHHQLARKAAAESMILLKNEKQILPLDTKKSIAVIGDFLFHPDIRGQDLLWSIHKSREYVIYFA